MTASTVLFSGETMLFGGLSNEDALASACPQEFKKDSLWSDYVARCIAKNSLNANGWKWKSTDKDEKRRQYCYFLGLLDSCYLPHEDKVAVAGWMLSEMLTEVPIVSKSP